MKKYVTFKKTKLSTLNDAHEKLIRALSFCAQFLSATFNEPTLRDPLPPHKIKYLKHYQNFRLSWIQYDAGGSIL